MIDSHAHLDFEQFEKDQDSVIENFLTAGGRAIVNVGVDLLRNKKSFEIAERFSKVFFSVGYHPEAAGKVTVEEVVLDLKKYLRKKKLVAIGEIGLDYFHETENKIEQKKLFSSQLNLAKENGMPVIIHCRDAYQDVFEIIRQKEFSGVKMVMHCYGGSLDDTEKFLSLDNLFFSFTGNITFPKNEEAEIFQVIDEIPLAKIMVETDCPFLAPQSHRGQRNEPSYVREVINKIASRKNFPPEEVELKTDEVAIKFFGF